MPASATNEAHRQLGLELEAATRPPHIEVARRPRCRIDVMPPRINRTRKAIGRAIHRQL